MGMVNNYHDFGGKPQYVQWARNAGVQITSEIFIYSTSILSADAGS